MSLHSLGLVAAFVAGIVSFLSPCVFPLVPGYLSYLTGTSLEEAQSKPTARWRVSLHALSFVLGFALIFTLLGAVAALVGLALHTYQQWLARIAGGIYDVLIDWARSCHGAGSLLPLPDALTAHRLHRFGREEVVT